MKALLTIIMALLSLQIFAEEVKSEDKTVKVKKSKDGSNVYNFHFYHDKKKKEEKADEPEQKEEDEIFVRKTSREKIDYYPPKRIGGSGLEIGFTGVSYTGNANHIASIKSGQGVKIGFVNMNATTGNYVTPGIKLTNMTAEHEEAGGFDVEYEGSAYELFVKFGKVTRNSDELRINYGLELGYSRGTLEADSLFFGYEPVELQAGNASLYGGLAIPLDNLLVTTDLNVGVSVINATANATFAETDSYGGMAMYSRRFKEKTVSPFYSLSVNAVFVF